MFKDVAAANEGIKMFGPDGVAESAFTEKLGKDPEPYAIYGYEAMSIALEAIKNAGDKGNDRQAVVDELFKIKGRESVLGTYDIDENGDTTLSDYGGNRIEGGKLVFDKVIKAATS